MKDAEMSANASNDNVEYPRTILIHRHSVVTRLTHWLNVLCLSFLLLSGLQMFNAHPELYWGDYGAHGDPAILTIGSHDDAGTPSGFLCSATIWGSSAYLVQVRVSACLRFRYGCSGVSATAFFEFFA